MGAIADLQDVELTLIRRFKLEIVPEVHSDDVTMIGCRERTHSEFQVYKGHSSQVECIRMFRKTHVNTNTLINLIGLF